MYPNKNYGYHLLETTTMWLKQCTFTFYSKCVFNVRMYGLGSGWMFFIYLYFLLSTATWNPDIVHTTTNSTRGNSRTKNLRHSWFRTPLLMWPWGTCGCCFAVFLVKRGWKKEHMQKSQFESLGFLNADKIWHQIGAVPVICCWSYQRMLCLNGCKSSHVEIYTWILPQKEPY